MIVFEYKLTGIELLTRMQVVNAVKRALRKTGEYWHEAFLWKRFTPLAYQEYGFKLRKVRKRHNARTKNPLVHTGEGMEEAMSETTVARIKVTRDSVTIPLPRKFNRYNPKGPNMSEEIRAVSRSEIRALEQNLVIDIEAELDKEVPAHMRNRGYIGGRVKSLSLKRFRRSPIVRGSAA